MQRKQVFWGRLMLAGMSATIISFMLGYFLYSLTGGVYASFGELPYAKAVDSIPIYLTTMMVGSLVLTLLNALVYALVCDALPGQKAWQKGLVFGLILLTVNVLPIAFNTWMQIAQPLTLILVEALNRTVDLLVQALMIALIYGAGKSGSEKARGSYA